MEGKIKNQKGFIKIPLLVIIIASMVTMSVIIGVILYKQEYDRSFLPSTPILMPTLAPTSTPILNILFTSTSTLTSTLAVTSIPTLAPTPIPTPTPTSTPEEETYVYHDYYPIILSLFDDKGNIIKPSNYNGYRGLYTSIKAKTPLKIGDEIYLKIEASDPQDRQILFGWQLSYKEAPANVRWTTNSEFRHQITAEDLKGAGEMFRIVAYIKSEKEYLRYAGLYDDAIFLDYILLP